MGLTKDERAYLAYLRADDAEQYEIVRERWSKLNWELLNKCDDAVDALQKGDSPAKISPLVISAGIGFDKLYAKRTEQAKPLAFPAPLMEMVRKGLRLTGKSVGSNVSTATASEAMAAPLPGEMLHESVSDPATEATNACVVEVPASVRPSAPAISRRPPQMDRVPYEADAQTVRH